MERSGTHGSRRKNVQSRIAAERKPHLTNEVIGDASVPHQEWARSEGMVAFAGYPLVVDDRLLGVMGMFSRNVLSEVTLRAMARVAGPGIDQMRRMPRPLAFATKGPKRFTSRASRPGLQAPRPCRYSATSFAVAGPT